MPRELPNNPFFVYLIGKSKEGFSVVQDIAVGSTFIV